MMCAWKQLLSVLPPRLRPEVDRLGKNALQELRLRLGMPPELVLSGESRWLGCCVSREDLNYCINAASRYSPWAAATTAQGYLTAPGGHRIGLCGEVVCKDGIVTGIREISSLCIRVARDFPGIAKRAADAPGSILILGAPGWGKTTLLRDLIRQIGEKQCVSVVDERGELFPEGLERGKKTDILTGCPKSAGDRVRPGRKRGVWVYLLAVYDSIRRGAVIRSKVTAFFIPARKSVFEKFAVLWV